MSFTRVNDRRDHFRDLSVWPRQQDLNVERWLTNFEADETDLAKRILMNFIYFNKTATDALMRQAIQNHLSELWKSPSFPKPPSKTTLTQVRFVYCEGEMPHATDSGYHFARRLRDALRVPEAVITSPVEALQASNHVKHFVFVDDFVGSGNQFRETISRRHDVYGNQVSFEDLSADKDFTIAYCPCISTKYAIEQNIEPVLPQIHIHPAHILDFRHTISDVRSRTWSGLTDLEAEEMIRKLKIASARAGYTREDRSEDDWRGFHGLALSVSFEHGIPDASLPIFYSNRNGWKPLMRRPQ